MHRVHRLIWNKWIRSHHWSTHYILFTRTIALIYIFLTRVIPFLHHITPQFVHSVNWGGIEHWPANGSIHRCMEFNFYQWNVKENMRFWYIFSNDLIYFTQSFINWHKIFFALTSEKFVQRILSTAKLVILAKLSNKKKLNEIAFSRRCKKDSWLEKAIHITPKWKSFVKSHTDLRNIYK